MEPRNEKTHSRFKLPTLIIGVSILLIFMIALYFISSEQSIDTVNIAVVTQSVQVNRSTVISEVEFITEETKRALDSEGKLPFSGAIPIGAELSFPDIEYQVFDVPELTRRDIGGLWQEGDPWNGAADGESNIERTGDNKIGDHHMQTIGFNSMKGSNVVDKIIGGVRVFNRYGDLGFIKAASTRLYNLSLNPYWNKSVEQETQANVVNGRYLAGFGKYFSNDNYNYTKWGFDANGTCYDVVLKDGTVIPFALMDGKSIWHTNNHHNTYIPLQMPEYEYIFQSVALEILEMFGTRQFSTSEMEKHLGISEYNPVVSIVRYNLWLDQLDVNGNIESEERRK